MNKNSRALHVSKSNDARGYYLREIKNRDYEPTIQEKEPFDTSDSVGLYHNYSTPIGRRPVPKSDLLSEHFKKNWMVWVLSAIGAAVIYFSFTFSRDQGKIEGIMSETHKNVTKIENEINKISEKTNFVENKTIENSGKIDNNINKIMSLEKKVDYIKK